MKISEINYSVIFDALKAYYEVEEDDSVWEYLIRQMTRLKKSLMQ